MISLSRNTAKPVICLVHPELNTNHTAYKLLIYILLLKYLTVSVRNLYFNAVATSAATAAGRSFAFHRSGAWSWMSQIHFPNWIYYDRMHAANVAILRFRIIQSKSSAGVITNRIDLCSWRSQHTAFKVCSKCPKYRTEQPSSNIQCNIVVRGLHLVACVSRSRSLALSVLDAENNSGN